MSPSAEKPIGEVVDLFCGVGAISHGFKRAGFRVVAGYDLDPGCRYAFETNNASRFIHKDIAEVTASEIRNRFSGNLPTILVGCAPCQPFSSYKKGQKDERWSLLTNFAHLAIEVEPDFISMENVSGLLEYEGGSLFKEFLTIIETKYSCFHQIIDCSDFGIPQKRKRLVVIGSKGRTTSLQKPRSSVSATVRDAIGHLEPLHAGQIASYDALHRSSKLSEINVARIRASRPGGTWKDWPEELVANCHKVNSGKGYGGVYGRMEWDRAAPTITTQCYGFGNGRFGHPSQDRGMSLREAAILQTFPESYEFFEEGKFPGFKSVGRWIGNAVPVALAEQIANSISEEIKALG